MAKAQKDEKTNAMRILEAAGVAYVGHTYDAGEGAPGGLEVAAALGQDPDRVFKTLVTAGHTGEHYVFLVSVSGGLDLKKAARAVGEKSIAMIHQKELLPLTGYVHGGCSPIGMKKAFPTVIDETAQLYDTIMFSGGRIGFQVEVAPEDLPRALAFTFADISS